MTLRCSLGLFLGLESLPRRVFVEAQGRVTAFSLPAKALATLIILHTSFVGEAIVGRL